MKLLQRKKELQVLWLPPHSPTYEGEDWSGAQECGFTSPPGNTKVHSHLKIPSLGWEGLESSLLLG